MTTPTEWQDRAERAEAELARLREQAPVATFRVTSRPYDMGRAEWMAHQGAPLKDGDLLYAAPPAQPAPRKMEIPPPMAEPLDVVYAEGWNAACDAFFGGLPPLEPLVVTIGAQPAAQPVQLTDPAYRTFGEFMALQDAPDVDVVESARIGWNACAAVQGQPCDYGEGYDIEAAPPAQPDDRTAQIVRPLPETMSRDEMLQHYSAHANLCAHEALQYQKRIRDLEKALAAQPAAQPVQRLSDERIDFLADRLWEEGHIQSLSKDSARIFARAIEAALQPQGWACVIAEADFEQNTVLLKMAGDDYQVSAGPHMLVPLPARPGDAS